MIPIRCKAYIGNTGVETSGLLLGEELVLRQQNSNGGGSNFRPKKTPHETICGDKSIRWYPVFSMSESRENLPGFAEGDGDMGIPISSIFVVWHKIMWHGIKSIHDVFRGFAGGVPHL